MSIDKKSAKFVVLQKKFLLDLDAWFRRRVRMVFLKRWKRAKTKIKNLMKLGLDVDSVKRIVYSRKGYWLLSKTVEMSLAISNKKLEANGFMFFLSLYNVKRTLLS